MAFTTDKTLLQRIKDGDQVSWEEFFRIYRRLIWVCGDDFQLTPHERQELIQLVMIEVFKSQPNFNYDRSKGRFRDYLRKIIMRQALKLRRKRTPLGAVEVEELETGEEEFEGKWQDEWRTHVLAEAMELLKRKMEPVTFQIFEMYALREMPAAEVALQVGVSANTVYIAKSRGAAILRQIIATLDEGR